MKSGRLELVIMRNVNIQFEILTNERKNAQNVCDRRSWMIRHNVSKTVVSQFLNMWVETIGTGRAGRGAAVLERIFYPLVRVLCTTCCNYLLISKAWKQRTKIRMGRLPFFVSADIQLIFFINNTDVTEWTTLLYVLWFIIICIFIRSESVLLICRYYHWDHG